MQNSRAWLWVECTAVFLVVPALFGLKLITTPLILLPLLLVCLPAVIWLGMTRGFTEAVFWRGDANQERQYLGFILKRFLVTSLLLVLVAALTMPLHLFDFPRSMPLLWLLFVVGYPLVSVYPQEVLYRAFFFTRYTNIFKNEQSLIWANAFLFGWMHVAFANVAAVVLTLISGWFFATTYHKTRSLRLVWFEHALYGALVFTVGYGRLFVFEPDFQSMLNRFGE